MSWKKTAQPLEAEQHEVEEKDGKSQRLHENAHQQQQLLLPTGAIFVSQLGLMFFL